MSQRRSGGHWVRGGPAGIESAAIRWRDLPRTAHLGERQLGNPPAGLGEPPPAADISRDRRAWGLAASGLAAILPNSHALLQWSMAGLRAATSSPRDRHKTQEQNKNFSKNEQNKTRWRGAAYCLGLVFCHGAHTREEQEHADEDLNSNNSL